MVTWCDFSTVRTYVRMYVRTYVRTAWSDTYVRAHSRSYGTSNDHCWKCDCYATDKRAPWVMHLRGPHRTSAFARSWLCPSRDGHRNGTSTARPRPQTFQRDDANGRAMHLALLMSGMTAPVVTQMRRAMLHSTAPTEQLFAQRVVGCRGPHTWLGPSACPCVSTRSQRCKPASGSTAYTRYVRTWYDGRERSSTVTHAHTFHRSATKPLWHFCRHSLSAFCNRFCTTSRANCVKQCATTHTCDAIKPTTYKGTYVRTCLRTYVRTIRDARCGRT